MPGKRKSAAAEKKSKDIFDFDDNAQDGEVESDTGSVQVGDNEKGGKVSGNKNTARGVGGRKGKRQQKMDEFYNSVVVAGKDADQEEEEMKENTPAGKKDVKGPSLDDEAIMKMLMDKYEEVDEITALGLISSEQARRMRKDLFKSSGNLDIPDEDLEALPKGNSSFTIFSPSFSLPCCRLEYDYYFLYRHRRWRVLQAAQDSLSE